MIPEKVDNNLQIDLGSSHIFVKAESGYIELSSSALIDTFNSMWTSLDEIEQVISNLELVILPGTIVVYNLGLEGVIYEYGNHGEYWEKIGVTCGYA